MSKNLLISLLALWAMAWSCRADTIYLKNGSKLTGKIVNESSSQIVIKVAFGQLTLDKKQVRKIIRSSGADNIIAQGDRLLALGAVEHGLRFYEEALSKNPGHPQLRRAIAQAYLKAGRHYLKYGQLTRARSCFGQARRYNPNLDNSQDLADIAKKEKWAQQQLRQADYFWHGGRASQALASYYRVFQQLPEWHERFAEKMARAAAVVGHLYLKQKNLAKACRYYKLAMEHWPEIYPHIEAPWIYANSQRIINQCYNKGRWQDAREQLAQLLKVAPTAAPPLFLIGLCFEKQQNYRDAWSYYNRVLGSNKIWSGSWQQLENLRQLAQNRAGIGMRTHTATAIPNDQPFQGQWSQHRTSHFLVLHQNNELAAKVGETLEHHWHRIHHRLAPVGWNRNWVKECRVYLYPSRQMYRAKDRYPVLVRRLHPLSISRSQSAQG